MKKIFLIIKREFLVQIRQKSFIIITCIAPIFIIGLLYIYSIINKYNFNKNYKICIINNNITFNINYNKYNYYNLYFYYYKYNIYNIKKLYQNFDGLLLITNNKKYFYIFNSDLIHYKNIINNILLIFNHSILLNTINKENNNKYYINNIKIIKFFNLKYNNIKAKTLFTIIMMYTLMMFIIMYSVKIMRSILEEKNSKIIEIIISSVNPFYLMIGKILGTAIVALTQFSIWIFSFLFLFYFLEKNILKSFLKDYLLEINIIYNNLFKFEYYSVIIIFFIYFIGGYLIFSSLLAAIASYLEIDSDHHQYSIIISIILFTSFYIGISIINSANNILIFILSIFPLTSPLIMLSKSCNNNIYIEELFISLLILFFSIWKSINIASKIYSKNILIFNKK